MKKQLYTCMAVIILSSVTHSNAAARSAKRIDFTTITPADALSYYAFKVNETQYATLQVPSRTLTERIVLAEDVKMKKAGLLAVYGVENAYIAQESYADVPTENQTYAEVSKRFTIRSLREILKRLSSKLNVSIKNILQDEIIFEEILRAKIANANVTKIHCIVRSLQFVHKAPIGTDVFALFNKNMEKVTDAIVAGIQASSATIKLQEPNPILDEIWERVPTPTSADLQSHLAAAWEELKAQQ